jgi:hypothetical protein
MTEVNQNCESYEPLISALLDGELESAELKSVNEHLLKCSTCREQMSRFRRVNQAVVGLSNPVYAAESGLQAEQVTVATKSVVPKNKLSRGSRGRVRFPVWPMIPAVVAASVLVCLLIIAIPNQKPAAAEQVPAKQVADPIRDLHLINTQQQRDQDLMLRTLGMDLRALKLELNQLEPGTPERIAMTKQIDLMLEKVRNFAAENSIPETN